MASAQLSAVVNKAVEYMTVTHQDRTREWCINKAIKDSGAEGKVTYNDVHDGINKLTDSNIGIPVGNFDIPNN